MKTGKQTNTADGAARRRVVLVGTYRGDQLKDWPGWYCWPLDKGQCCQCENVASAQSQLPIKAVGKLETGNIGMCGIRTLATFSNCAATQIDHIVISQWGIFVIETKTYSGWVFGDAKSAQWTVSHFRRKDRFQNPLRQNYKHIGSVERENPMVANSGGVQTIQNAGEFGNRGETRNDLA